MELCEVVDNEAWTPCKPGWVGVGEGVEPGTGEVRASPPGGRGMEMEKAEGGMRAETLAPHIQDWVS